MFDPLISCIITSYNNDNYIEESILSVLNQTYNNIELLIIDDASTDNSFQIINKYKNDNRIRIIIRKDNSGLPSIVRNQGIRLARGEYIAFLDGDDYWLQKKLEEQLKSFDLNIVGVGSNMGIIAGNNPTIKEAGSIKDQIFDLEKILMINNVPLSSLIIRNLGYYFDESPQYKYAEDWEFQARIIKESDKKIKLLSNTHIVYRIHNNSGSRKHENIFRQNQLNVINTYSSQLTLAKKNKLYSLVYFYLGKQCLISRDYEESKKYFIRSCKIGFLRNAKYIKNLLGIIICYLPSGIQTRLVSLLFAGREAGI